MKRLMFVYVIASIFIVACTTVTDRGTTKALTSSMPNTATPSKENGGITRDGRFIAYDNDKTYNLIRALLKQRIYSDPSLKNQYMSGNVPKVESLPEIVLLGLPEGTIFTIVETYFTKKKDSSPSDEVVLYSIEKHRKILFPESGIMPTPLTLSSYIK
ncbi:MAG: hypothetical protein HQ557_07310, partial [Bacteroidetes bacterium]|nr:hypothetical protein [Bacteroidota bacterium]